MLQASQAQMDVGVGRRCHRFWLPSQRRLIPWGEPKAQMDVMMRCVASGIIVRHALLPRSSDAVVLVSHLQMRIFLV